MTETCDKTYRAGVDALDACEIPGERLNVTVDMYCCNGLDVLLQRIRVERRRNLNVDLYTTIFTEVSTITGIPCWH